MNGADDERKATYKELKTKALDPQSVDLLDDNIYVGG